MAKETTYDMTKGNPVRLLILFTIPMLLGNVVQQLYSSVDSIVVGHFVSVEAMAAITILDHYLQYKANKKN